MSVRIVLFLLLFSMAAYAAFPKAFATLADPVYEDAAGYKQVCRDSAFDSLREEACRLYKAAQSAQKLGYLVDKTGAKRVEYVALLRKLQRESRMLFVKIERRMRELYDAKKFARLIRYADSRSHRFSKHPLVLRALKLQNDDSGVLSDLRRRLDRSKEALFRARESAQEENGKCLNALTATYRLLYDEYSAFASKERKSLQYFALAKKSCVGYEEDMRFIEKLIATMP